MFIMSMHCFPGIPVSRPLLTSPREQEIFRDVICILKGLSPDECIEGEHWKSLNYCPVSWVILLSSLYINNGYITSHLHPSTEFICHWQAVRSNYCHQFTPDYHSLMLLIRGRWTHKCRCKSDCLLLSDFTRFMMVKHTNCSSSACILPSIHEINVISGDEQQNPLN